jgi:hypothetical protein
MTAAGLGRSGHLPLVNAGITQSVSVNSKYQAIRSTLAYRKRRYMLPLPPGEGWGEGSSARACNSRTRSQNCWRPTVSSPFPFPGNALLTTDH